MTQITLIAAPGNATERVLWALNFKALPFQKIDVASLKADGTYAQINPFGYVPTLKVDQDYIAESVAIIEFLEELYPHPSLLPGSALQRAQIREVCEFVNATIHPAQNRSILNFLRPDLEPTSMQALRANWLHKSLSQLQSRLWKNSAFAVGSLFSQADIFVALMYRRALSQGVVPESLPDYGPYLDCIFKDPLIKNSAPFVWP